MDFIKKSSIIFFVVPMATGCTLSGRQMDIAEAYTAVAENFDNVVKPAILQSEDCPPAAEAVAVREAYVELLKHIVDKKLEHERPGGFRSLNERIIRYDERLQECHMMGDAIRLRSAKKTFEFKLKTTKCNPSTDDFEKMLKIALQTGTSLIRQIDAMVYAWLTKRYNDTGEISESGSSMEKERRLIARYTDIHFATRAQLSGHRSCWGENEFSCRATYNVICAVAREKADNLPSECKSKSRPRWTR